MNVQEVHIRIQETLENVGVFLYSDFTHDEINIYLNQTINSFINWILTPKDKRKPEEYPAFQEVVATMDDLRVLQRTQILSTTTVDNIASINLNSLSPSYMHYIRAEARVGINCRNDLEYSYRPVSLVNSESIFKLQENTITRSKPRKPNAEVSNNSLNLLLDGFSITNVRITYLKRPEIINYVNPTTTIVEFPDDTMMKIIKLTSSEIMKVSEQSQQKIVNLEQRPSTL